MLQLRFQRGVLWSGTVSLVCLIGCTDASGPVPASAVPTVSQPEKADSNTEQLPPTKSDSDSSVAEQSAPLEEVAAPSDTAEPAAAASTATPSTDGLWKIKSAMIAGAPFPSEIADTISLTLNGNDYIVMVGNVADKGTSVVDRTVSPNQMTITGTDGPNKGKTILAVCDFPDATTMRVSYDLSGKAFPTTFESTAENGLYVVTYTKQQ